jgi:hypothetical protein
MKPELPMRIGPAMLEEQWISFAERLNQASYANVFRWLLFLS